jgi:hypothetical protein
MRPQRLLTVQTDSDGGGEIITVLADRLRDGTVHLFNMDFRQICRRGIRWQRCQLEPGAALFTHVLLRGSAARNAHLPAILRGHIFRTFAARQASKIQTAIEPQGIPPSAALLILGGF